MKCIDSISQYNACLGCRTFHPMISLIRLFDATPIQEISLEMGCYAVFLKEDGEEGGCYGRKECDYQDGMLLCFTPQHFMETCCRNAMFHSGGYLLILHNDWVRCSSLGATLSRYTFLSYTKEEALHLSLREKLLLIECLQHIDRELKHHVDRFSEELIAKYVGLLLDYCARFYERQFIMRSDLNQKVVQETCRLLSDYFAARSCHVCKLPDSGYFAARLGMSSFYLDDLIKVETGKAMAEFVKCQRLEIAKRWLQGTDMPIAQIASVLGFCSVYYFNFLFKKLVGVTPAEYRQSC